MGIIAKTVAKWPKRATVEDRKTGSREPRSTVLTETEEAMIVAFRRHTLLPLDDCLYALQPTIPHLTRSALHRCLQRASMSCRSSGSSSVTQVSSLVSFLRVFVQHKEPSRFRAGDPVPSGPKNLDL